MKQQICLAVTCMHCLLAAFASAESDPVMRYAAQKRLDSSRVTWMLLMSSVGELVRQSQAIVEGEITMLRVEAKDKSTGTEDGNVSPSSWADVRIDDVLRGDRELIGESVAVEIRSTEPRPDEGFHGWIFLTRKPMDLLRDFPGLSRDRLSGFDRDRKEYEHWIMAGGVRGCLAGDKAFVAELERYVDTYIRWFWTRNITAAEVAVMLGEMMESAHDRLREDAVYDLSHMYASLSVDERRAIASDDRVPPQARDRIARRLERDEKMAAVRQRSRDELLSVLDDAHVRQALESNEPRSILKGLEVIDAFTRHERVTNPDLWAHLLRPHLDSKDPYIRWRVAVNLHQINDPTALRVLMKTIDDLDPRYYDRLRNDLQKMTRQNLPLESDAPKEIQATQLRAWKDWWNLQEKERQERQNEDDIVIPLL
jgi:hypothetical protein